MSSRPAHRKTTRWIAAEVPDAAAVIDDQQHSNSAERGSLLAPLLARRGVTTPDEARTFLNPTPDQLHDPAELHNLQAVVERLQLARERGERIAIVGDYDVDGVSATALLTGVFGACGVEVEAILPHRLRDGYGFQPVHVERAVAAQCSLILTADCGTTSHAAAEAALAAELDVIVTDHHLPADPLPEAVLQINPKQEACAYPFDELAAAGIALKLALAFAEAVGRDLPIDRLLAVACLGTIADVVPLVGENRIIAALGLRALPHTRSVGLRALIERSGVKPPLRAADVGFRLGPRINAAGRLDDAEEALKLLLTRDRSEAQRLADDLERKNRDRQGQERRVLDQAREMILTAASPDDTESPSLPPILVAWSESWHRGVVGIAAGRISREFQRPTLLLAVEDGSAVGSGRSIPGVHLHQFLSRWDDRFERFGGHAQAVGLTVAEESLGPLRLQWQEAATTEWDEEVFEKRYEYELALAAEQINSGLLEELLALEPHGQNNPQPLLKVGPLELASPTRTFGKGHLGAQVREPGTSRFELAVIGWGWGERASDLAGTFEVLAHLEEDAYRGGHRLRLVDCRPVEASAP